MKLTAGPLGKPVVDLFRDPLLPCVLVCQVLLQMWVLVRENWVSLHMN